MSGPTERRLRARASWITAVVAGCVLWPAAIAAAADVDTVRLKNGDHLTCEVKKLQQGVLSISADPLGKVSIHWGEVAGVASPREFEVTVESGHRYYGSLSVSAAGGELVVTATGATPVTLRLMDVTALVPIGTSLWRRMDGSVDLGFSLAQANLETHWTLNGATTYRSRRFRVSARWIRKLLAQRAKTGSIAPKPKAGGRKRLIQGEHAESLRTAVDETPDATLRKLREAIGFGGCLMTVWRSLRRLRITRKKSRCGLGSNSIRRSSSNVGTGGSGRRMSTRAGSSSSTRATPRRP